MKSVVDLKVKGAWGGAVHPRHWRELEEVKGARGSADHRGRELMAQLSGELRVWPESGRGRGHNGGG
jgi:hypothetical protein